MVRFRFTVRHYTSPFFILVENVPNESKLPLWFSCLDRKIVGNTGRLALRQSRSRATQALIDWLGQPLISTSANVSGQPTCHTGIETFGTMDGRIDLVLDGGVCVGAARPRWISPSRAGN
jgi:L-threonylcarbamoyladenylate synthase